jgi:hypothetical protein
VLKQACAIARVLPADHKAVRTTDFAIAQLPPDEARSPFTFLSQKRRGNTERLSLFKTVSADIADTSIQDCILLWFAIQLFILAL